MTMPDVQTISLSARELRDHGFTRMIGATCRHHDEEQSLLDAGVDKTVLTYEESGSGLAEHIIEAAHVTQAD